MFIVEYDIKDSSREELFLSDLKGLGDTNLFLPRSFFLISTEPRELVYKRLRSHLASEDLLLIVETSLSDMSGWLPMSSIRWVQTHKEND